MPPRFRKVLKLAQSYVGKDALTQAELLRVAALDFRAPDVQAYLAQAFPAPAAAAAASSVAPSTPGAASGPGTRSYSAPTRACATATPRSWAGSTCLPSRN